MTAKTKTPAERAAFWESVVDSRCECGCLGSNHESLFVPSNHGGRCTACGSCERFTWVAHIRRRAPRRKAEGKP